MAVTVVAIEAVLSIGSYEQILVTVVVVICGSHTHTVPDTLDSGLLGDVFKASILLLAIEAIPIFRPSLLRNSAFQRRISKGGAVDQVKIQPAIIVAIKKGDTGTHGFNQVLFGCVRCLVQKAHPGTSGNVHEFARNIGRNLGRWSPSDLSGSGQRSPNYE